MESSIPLVPLEFFQTTTLPELYCGVVYWYTNQNEDILADYGKVYVGYTLDEEQRRTDWKNLSSDYAGTKINEARKRTPLDKWKYDRIYIWDADPDRLEGRLKMLETSYIDHFDSYENGFNGNRGGRGIAAWVQFRVTDITGSQEIVRSYNAVTLIYGVPRGSIAHIAKNKVDHLAKNGVKIERIN